MSYLPISSGAVYDRFGSVYNVSSVLDQTAGLSLNTTAYYDYSPLYLTTTYVAVFTMAFAVSTAVLVHTALHHGPSILAKLRNVRTESEDVHAKLMRYYPEVPDWWYMIYFAVFFGIGCVAIEVWHTGLPIWGLVLAVLLPAIYMLPAGFIFALTYQLVAINLLAELIPGYIFVGQPIAVMTATSRRTSHTTVARSAPSAMRMPISRVRRETVYDITP